jgi:hypothetical protein
MLGSVDLASPPVLPFTAQVDSAPTLRRPTRDECDIHDMMCKHHHPTGMGRRFVIDSF